MKDLHLRFTFSKKVEIYIPKFQIYVFKESSETNFFENINPSNIEYPCCTESWQTHTFVPLFVDVHASLIWHGLSTSTSQNIGTQLRLKEA